MRRDLGINHSMLISIFEYSGKVQEGSTYDLSLRAPKHQLEIQRTTKFHPKIAMICIYSACYTDTFCVSKEWTITFITRGNV